MPEIRILAVAAGRGGTGKSTLAFAIADAIRQMDPALDVALLDLDPQAGLTGYAKRQPAADPIHDAPAPVHGLTLYRGGRALAHAGEAELVHLIERALAERAPTDDAPTGTTPAGTTPAGTTPAGTTGAAPARDRVVVADMAPALTDAAHRVLLARDDVMLIGAIKTEPGSFQSLNELVAVAAKRGLPYVLVPTIHRNVLLNSTMLLTMRQQHEGHVSDVVVPLDGKAAECVIHGQPVTMYARRSKAAQAVRQLVQEIFGDAEAEPAAAPPTTPDPAARRRTSTSARR